MTPLERDAIKAALRNIHADDEHPDLSYERGMEILDWLCRTGNSGRRDARLRELIAGGPVTPLVSPNKTVSVFEAAADAARNPPIALPDTPGKSHD